MNKRMNIFGILVLLLFLVGCTAAIVAQIFGLAIAIGGEWFCSEVEEEPLQEICHGVVGIILQIAEGTIEVQNEQGEWVTLTSDPADFDLLDSQGQQQIIIHKEIPPGRYTKLRIDLEGLDIQTRDKTYSTILPEKDLIIDIDMIVDENQKSIVELDLDLAQSLHLTEENELVFAPVMDVKSKRNANVEVLDPNKKIIKVRSGAMVESKRVGMDLDGKFRNNFALDRSKKISYSSGKLELLEEAPKKIRNIEIEEDEESYNIQEVLHSNEETDQEREVPEELREPNVAQEQEDNTGETTPAETAPEQESESVDSGTTEQVEQNYKRGRIDSSSTVRDGISEGVIRDLNRFVDVRYEWDVRLPENSIVYYLRDSTGEVIDIIPENSCEQNQYTSLQECEAVYGQCIRVVGPASCYKEITSLSELRRRGCQGSEFTSRESCEAVHTDCVRIPGPLSCYRAGSGR